MNPDQGLNCISGIGVGAALGPGLNAPVQFLEADGSRGIMSPTSGSISPIDLGLTASWASKSRCAARSSSCAQLKSWVLSGPQLQVLLHSVGCGELGSQKLQAPYLPRPCTMDPTTWGAFKSALSAVLLKILWMLKPGH